jgi:hypothetical protein
MVAYPVVYTDKGIPVNFVCLVDEDGAPTLISLVSGPISAADGEIFSIGSTTDPSTSFTVIGLLKQLSAQFAAGIPIPVNITISMEDAQLATESNQELGLSQQTNANATLTAIENILSTIEAETGTTPQLTPLGYQQIPAATPAVIAPNLPVGTTRIFVIAEVGQGFRWRDDGVNPDAATGMICWAGSSLDMNIVNPAKFKMFPLDATTVINLSYYS